MALAVLGPLNDVINKTATEILDAEISKKTADVLSTFVTASFDAMDDVLKTVQDLTKEDSDGNGSS
jgi:N-acetylglucosamine-6-phosphate deacetylase